MKRLIRWVLWGCTLVLLFVLFSNWVVIRETRADVVSDLDNLEPRTVALVLGTSKRTQIGAENLFFKDRITAAAQLYKQGKVRHLIVSGDNRSKYYNEPKDMLEALEVKGIPESAVTLDFAGLRTLDSIVRCQEIFGQSDVIIVTQRFHGYRAQFLAQRAGLRSQVYAADFENEPFRSLLIREVLARAVAVSDLYIFKRSPKFLGEEIDLKIE